MIHNLKSQVLAEFDMNDSRIEKHILEINLKRDRENINLWLSQINYVNSMLQHFNIIDCRPCSVLISMGTNILV